MSIEQTPPNLDHTPDNEAVEDRISDDIDRIHALCEILEPSFEQIEAGMPIEDESLRDKFTELTVLLAELHPADVAAVLESLPPRERNIVWLLVAPGRRRRSIAGSIRRRTRNADRVHGQRRAVGRRR